MIVTFAVLELDKSCVQNEKMIHRLTPAKFLITLQEIDQVPVGFNVEGYGYDIMFTVQGGYSVFSEAQLKSKTRLYGREAYYQDFIGAN